MLKQSTHRAMCLLLTLMGLEIPIALSATDLITTYQAALQYDPRYQAATYQYEESREALPQARALLLPVLQADFRRYKTEQDIRERDNVFFGAPGRTRFWSSARTVQLTQPIFRYANWVRLRQAKAAVRQAFAEFTAAEQSLVRRTVESYVLVLAAQDNVTFLEAEQAAVGKQLQLVQGRRRGGLANITDEFEAKARTARVQADLIEAEFVLEDAYQGLRELIGNRVSEINASRADFPLAQPEPADMASWVRQALINNFELLAANEAVVQSRQEIKAQRAGHYPTIDLVARDSNQDIGGAVTGGGSNVDTADVALEFTLPLYSGGRVRSQTRQAQQRHLRTIEEQRLQQRTVERETQGAFQSVQSSIARAVALRESIAAMESALSGKQRGYRSGVSTLVDVLDAERDLFATRRELANARFEYLLGMLRLREQVGILGEDDISNINALLHPPAGPLN